MSQQEAVWAPLLGIALVWVLVSTFAAAESMKYGMRRRAWAWTATFVLSSLAAAYSFWRLV